MGERRSPYLIAKTAILNPENDLNPFNLSTHEISVLKDSFRDLGIGSHFYDIVIDHFREALAYARLEAELQTPTGEELGGYYQEISKLAKKLETLIAPIDKEWHQLDRYWPEEPDKEGNATYSWELLNSLRLLQKAASSAAVDKATIRGHAIHHRKNPRQILALSVSEVYSMYFSSSPFPGSDNGPVVALYCKLCDIAKIDPPASPRHILDKFKSGESRAGYGRPPWEFPFQHTQPGNDISEEDLEFLQEIFGDSND